MRPITYIDVSGVGNSGKSALVDLLREVEGIWVPGFQFEFDLVRLPGGLLDLRQNLVEAWSPIRSRACLLRFRKVARLMGGNPAWWDVAGHLNAAGNRYDGHFAGQFTKACMEYADSFLLGTYPGEWPYDDHDIGGLRRVVRKSLARMGFRKHLLRDIHLVDGQDFDRKTKALMDRLYSQVIAPGDNHVVLNNGFEPFFPEPGLDMLAPARQIVVVRDPRDIYVSGKRSDQVAKADRKLLAWDNDGLGKSFLGTSDLRLFTERFKLYFRNLYDGRDPRVLHIRFEDLVLDYDRSVSQILEFLGFSNNSHTRMKSKFDPARSCKSIGIWKAYSRQDEIRYLEDQLGGHLYEGPIETPEKIEVKT